MGPGTLQLQFSALPARELWCAWHMGPVLGAGRRTIHRAQALDEWVWGGKGRVEVRNEWVDSHTARLSSHASLLSPSTSQVKGQLLRTDHPITYYCYWKCYLFIYYLFCGPPPPLQWQLLFIAVCPAFSMCLVHRWFLKILVEHISGFSMFRSIIEACPDGLGAPHSSGKERYNGSPHDMLNYVWRILQKNKGIRASM